MTQHASALSFLDSGCRGLISDYLLDTISAVDFDLQGSQNQLKVKAISIGEWGLLGIEGRCKGVTRFDENSLRTSKYAALTLSLHPSAGGLPHRQLQFTQKPLQETLFLPEHRFSYISAYIPQASIEAASGGNVIGDCLIDTERGPGRVIRATLVSLMQQAMASGGHGGLAGMLPGFLSMVLGSIHQGMPPALDTPFTTGKFHRLMRHLEHSFRDPDINPAAVASACCVSERQLYREFENHNLSFAGELRRLRLHFAREMLLRRADKSILEVAYGAGFSCPSVFTKAFRQVYGQSPRDFRSTHQNG